MDRKKLDKGDIDGLCRIILGWCLLAWCLMVLSLAGCDWKELAEADGEAIVFKKLETTEETIRYGFYGVKIIASPVFYGTEYRSDIVVLASSKKEAVAKGREWYNDSDCYNPTYAIKIKAKFGVIYDPLNINHVKFKSKSTDEFEVDVSDSNSTSTFFIFREDNTSLPEKPYIYRDPNNKNHWTCSKHGDLELGEWEISLSPRVRIKDTVYCFECYWEIQQKILDEFITGAKVND